KVHFPDTGVQGLPNFIALAMFAQLLWHMLTRRLALPVLHPFVVLTALYALIVLIQLRNPVSVHTGQAIDGARIYLLPMVLFLVGLEVMRAPENARLLLRVLVATAVVVAAVMLKQLLF